MIKLNKLTDYAIVILTYLAGSKKQFCTVTKISDATQLPQPTVAKLMKQLSKLNLVSASRGAYGGYQLNIEPSKMSIADVIKKFEGSSPVTACNSPNSQACALNQCCTLGPLWHKIHQELMAVLKNYTIESFVHHEELSTFILQSQKQPREKFNA